MAERAQSSYAQWREDSPGGSTTTTFEFLYPVKIDGTWGLSATPPLPPGSSGGSNWFGGNQFGGNWFGL